MAERCVCAVCFTPRALAKDGTPYKHDAADGSEPCPGSDEQALPEMPWHVYGAELTFDGIDQFPVAVVGPVAYQPLEEIDYSDTQTLAYLGSYDHAPTPDDFMLIVPEQFSHLTPPGPGVSEAATELPEADPSADTDS